MIKKILFTILFSFFTVLLFSCENIKNLSEKEITVNYELGGGRFLDDKLNAKIENNNYKITLKKDDNTIMQPGEEIDNIKREPLVSKDEKIYYLEYYYLKNDPEKKAFFFTEQKFDDPGDRIKLKKSITLVAKYSENPGPLKLNSILKKFRMSLPVPSVGQINTIVLPVVFDKNTDKDKFKSDLDDAFNKTINENGFYGVAEYFKIVSKGLLNLKFHILDPVDSIISKDEATEMKKKNKFSLPEQQIISEALYKVSTDKKEMFEFLFKNNDFDYNQDGNIDSVIAVYDIENIKFDINKINDIKDNLLWFSYSSRMVVSRTFPIKLDGKSEFIFKISDYTWTSYNFLKESLYAKTKIGEKITPTMPEFKYNTIFYIHEVAKLLGLVDLFSFNIAKGSYLKGGLGQTDILDMVFKISEFSTTPPYLPTKYQISFGMGFNPYNKVLLDWANYDLKKDDINTYTLENNEGMTLDKVFLIPKNKNNNSLFGEFLLVEYYKPKGIYEILKLNNLAFTKPCVRVYHIDSTIKEDGYQRDLSNLIFLLYKRNNLQGLHKYMRLVEKENKIEQFPYIFDDDKSCYFEGESLTNFKWYDGTPLGYDLKFTNFLSNSAKVEIIK